MTAPLIGIVGPCAAGKSTLGDALRDRGYRVKEILQEHSLAPTMWKRITNPDILIYLDVTEEEAARREGLAKPSSWWKEERDVRLIHARQHCDLYVDTSKLSPEEILTRVITFFEKNADESANAEIQG
jgi:RNase adaptor protein for sRNA GlmZ degradation